jgi:hypothetical protein
MAPFAALATRNFTTFFAAIFDCCTRSRVPVVLANSDLAAGKGTWAFSPDICSAGG